MSLKENDIYLENKREEFLLANETASVDKMDDISDELIAAGYSQDLVDALWKEARLIQKQELDAHPTQQDMN